jgi:Uma2 family endonuclease
MTLPGRKFTYEDYKQLPDDQRYEVLEGELVMTPAPKSLHQLILANLHLILGTFVREHGLGKLLFAPTDVVLSERNVVQPDLLFVASNRISIIDLQGAVHGAPDLVVEVLSPSTARRDLEIKMQIYSTYGVREYWIVDPEAGAIEVLTNQGPGLETWQRFPKDGTLTSPTFPALKLNVAQVFDVD